MGSCFVASLPASNLQLAPSPYASTEDVRCDVVREQRYPYKDADYAVVGEDGLVAAVGSIYVEHHCAGAIPRLGEVVLRLADDDWETRRAAVQALPHVLQKGDDYAIVTVTTCCSDADARVRRAAIRVLPQVVGKGDERAIRALLDCCKDADRHVRHEAVVALPQVAKKGNERAILAVSACCNDPDEDVREAAQQVLPQVVERSGVLHEFQDSKLLRPTSCDECNASLKGWLAQGQQCKACQRLVCLVCAVRGHRCVQKAVASNLSFCLDTPLCGQTDIEPASGPISQADTPQVERTPRAFAGADICDDEFIGSVIGRLEHADAEVRQATLKALSDVVEKGDERVINAVTALLEHADSEVRECAVQALPRVAEKGDRYAFEAVAALFDHHDWWVREAAVRALPLVTEKGDERAIAALKACLADNERNVKLATLHSLSQHHRHARSCVIPPPYPE